VRKVHPDRQQRQPFEQKVEKDMAAEREAHYRYGEQSAGAQIRLHQVHQEWQDPQSGLNQTADTPQITFN